MSRRWWIALAYALATIVAQGAHDHGHESHAAPRPEAGCEDGGVHLAHHPDAPDLDHPHDVCGACQFRADHQAAPLRNPHASVEASFRGLILAAPILAPVVLHRHRCRAPPLA